MESISSKLKILIPDPVKNNPDIGIKSYLSFAPFYRNLQKRVQNPNEQFLGFYRYVIKKLEENPELLEPLNDPEIIYKHEGLFQLIASTLFPISTDNNLQYYALGSPYKFEIFFYSHSFVGYFHPDENGYINFPPERPLAHLQAEYDLMAYRLIFRKFFEIELKIPERRTNQWVDSNTGLHRYSRVHIDESFIDVSLTDELPSLPSGLIDPDSGSISDINLLKKQFPLSLFLFEGFIIRRSIADVTVEECVKEVKNAIIEMQSSNPKQGYQKLRSAVETMIGSKDVEVSLNTFLQLNKKFVYYHKYSGKSILLQGIDSVEEKETAYNQIAAFLNETKKPLFINNLQREESEQNNFPFIKYLKNSTFCCYIIVPLFENKKLIGMMEAASPNVGALKNETLTKLEPVFSYFEMACRNDIAQFKKEIESFILERYTALLPVVDWKFKHEAWLYLKEKETDPNREIGTVNFNPVYPVYGAIDVKNSSNERRVCYQKDILDHLNLIESTLIKLNEEPHELVQEAFHSLLEKNTHFREKIGAILLPEDEQKINEFIENDIKIFFEKLAEIKSEKLLPVKDYMELVDQETGHLIENRRKFDESIDKVNATISRYLETEQEKIQKQYPHYFEKFRTDGVEFNIYVGESFTPYKQFDLVELKKIRLWQLTVMASLTRITHQLKESIPIPLETTQLVLVFDKPISISFRRDERRFDVEGQESVQFEILKKRIDKVKIKDSGERLTKPGTIAIVYSNTQEIVDYGEYFNFLQKNNLVVGEQEMLELEDVQSISGLKAIRITVNMKRE